MPNLAHKVRLYPTAEQEILFRKTVGCCRLIYNYYLAFQNTEYERYCKWGKRYPNKPAKDFQWRTPPTEAKLKEEFEFLKEVNAQALQQSRKDLETAFKRFFSGASQRPKFHKKGIKESFRIPQFVRVEDSKLFLQKYGRIRFRGSPNFPTGKIKSATVKSEAGKWYASILYEVSEEYYYQPVQHKHDVLGIDLGVVQPLTVTNGTQCKVLGVTERQRLIHLERRRKHYTRCLTRKKKGSNNRAKSRARLARAYQKERNYRKNFQEQVSHRLTKSSHTIVFEDLKLSCMTRSAKGTIDSPGRNVRQKTGLNREMLRIGLAGLVTKFKEKAHRRGGTVVLVDPRFTSQTCSDCGTIDKRSRESQSRFHCVHCGFKINADFNAAINVLRRGYHPE